MLEQLAPVLGAYYLVLLQVVDKVLELQMFKNQTNTSSSYLKLPALVESASRPRRTRPT